MLSKSLSTSRKMARLYDVAGPLAEFCHSLFGLLVAHSDDHGRLQGDPFTVRMVCLPISPRPVADFGLALQAMDDVGLIRWYEANGETWVQITKFDEHQPGLLSKRTPSKLPAPQAGSIGVPRITPRESTVTELTGNPPKPMEVPSQLKRTQLNSTQPPSEKSTARDEPRAPTTALLRHFDVLHRQRTGSPAVIQGGKDAKLVGGLWRTHGEAEVLRLMRAFFESDDPFIHKAGYTVGVFVSQAAKLIASSIGARDPTDAAWDRLRERVGVQGGGQ